MNVIECCDCGETVPVARNCLSCDEETSSPVVPPREEGEYEATQRYSDFAFEATHESVTFDALRSNHDAYDRPLGAYLFDGEQPEALCDLDGYTITRFDDTSWTAGTGFLDSGHLVVTDRRVIGVIPNGDSTQVVAADFVNAVAVETTNTWRKTVLSLDLVDGGSYAFSVEADGDRFAEIADLTRDLEAQADSTASDAAKFVRNVDARIAAAEDAESALRAVADQFAAREEETHFDHAVAQADSVEDLMSELAAASPALHRRDDETDPERGDSGTAVPALPSNVDGLRRRFGSVAADADPKQVGLYTLGITAGFGTYAVTAPFSTTLGLAALAASGAATGAYASANPDSLAARIDPIALATNANRRAAQLENSPAAGGQATGTLLGAAEHLSRMDYDAAYADWISQVDIDAIMRGAEHGARQAEQSSDIRYRGRASALGGIAGLAYGYSGLDDELDTFVDDGVMETVLADTEQSIQTSTEDTREGLDST